MLSDEVTYTVENRILTTETSFLGNIDFFLELTLFVQGISLTVETNSDEIDPVDYK